MANDRDFIARWRITWMDAWDQDYVDAEEEAYVRFDNDEEGEFHFGYVHGQMTCERTERGGRPAMEWSWEGNDEMHPASGRGWAVIRDDGTLGGAIHFHRGDKSAFEAEWRGAVPRKPRKVERMTILTFPAASTPSPAPAPPPAAPPVHLEHHRRLRRILRKHQNAAVKTVPATALRTVAREFGLVDDARFLIETDAELIILFDYLIYNHLRQGRTAVQRYVEKLKPTRSADEQLVRAAMTQARFSVFDVERVEPGVGMHLRDLARGDAVFVVDEAMSQTIAPGRRIAYRILPLPGYWMPTGAGFPVSDDIADGVIEAVVPRLRKIADGDLSVLDHDAEGQFAAAVLAAGFDDGSTGTVAYR